MAADQERGWFGAGRELDRTSRFEGLTSSALEGLPWKAPPQDPLPPERSTPVQYVSLGSQGLTVSRQGLGCMGMSEFYGPHDDDPAKV